MKLLKVAGKIISGFVVFVGLYFGADAVLSRIPGHADMKHDQTKDIAIFVMSNGVHTDVVLPVRHEKMDWSSVFPFENTIGKNSNRQYVGIGWGDKGFYLNTPKWEDLKLSTAMVAILGLGETALHVTYYKRVQEDELCYKVMISQQQYKMIGDYILGSLNTDLAGKPVCIETTAQYGQDDAFYEAEGAYSLFFSCNTWTNKMLKKAGLPSGVWTVLDKGILRHYQKH